MAVKRGSLFVVATPIGNLEDITLRALDTLRKCPLVICEDTRKTARLFSRHGISASAAPYYSPREKLLAGRYISRLESGDDIALVSESGTPCVSDPGYEIVRRAHEAGIRVVPVPGPSALASSLSVSGIPCREVFFAGFLPRKKTARRRYLEKHLGQGYTVVFYDSKYRIRDTVGFISEIAPGLEICLCREITKKFEELIRGAAASVSGKLGETSIKGEFTVVCSPSEK